MAALHDAVYRGVITGRHAARVAGIEGIATSLGYSGRIELAGTLADVKRAESISKRFATFVRDKLEQGAPLKSIDSRLSTIAITENAQAINEQRREVISQLTSQYNVPLVEVWDATLDQRTCESCMALDGAESIDGAGFPGGEVPGAVHPRCRCTSHFIRIH